MEAVVVLAAALVLFSGLGLALRRHRRMIPDDAEYPENRQRAESWLPKGGGRG
jgi:hypothetical protein